MLKKILTVCCIVGLTAVTLAAAYDEQSAVAIISKLNDQAARLVQGHGIADAQIVVEGQKFLAETEFKTDTAKRRYLYIFRHLTFIANPKTTFAEWKAKFDAKYAELKFEKQSDTNTYLWMMTPWYAHHCFKDGYEFMVSLDDWKTFDDAPYWCISNGKYEEAWEAFLVNQKQVSRIIKMCMVNLQDPAKAMTAAKTLVTRDCTANELTNGLIAIQNMMVNSGKFSDEQMKELLVQLNRKYSGKLIDDEATWTPVVKRIHTMLGTY